MRASHILAALGATTTALAQNTSPIPDAVAAQSADCTSTSTTWTLPSISATSTGPASFTLTVDLSPANGTVSSGSSVSAALPTTAAATTTTTPTTADTATESPPPATSSTVAAAAPGEGLSTDSSMLGLVVFFALSLCLL